jgi:cyclopropane-fatty-acyl-phospholipid synthase
MLLEAPAVDKLREILEEIFKTHPKDFNIRLWNGKTIEWTPRPSFTLIFNNRSAVKNLFLKGNAYAAGKAFIEKDLDIEGDIFEAMKLADHLSQLRLPIPRKIALLTKLITL